MRERSGDLGGKGGGSFPAEEKAEQSDRDAKQGNASSPRISREAQQQAIPAPYHAVGALAPFSDTLRPLPNPVRVLLVPSTDAPPPQNHRKVVQAVEFMKDGLRNVHKIHWTGLSLQYTHQRLVPKAL
jgi:hypothetical protein